MSEPSWLRKIKYSDYSKEDFNSEGKSRYSINRISKSDPEWLDKAAKEVNAVSGDDYVKLDAGLLTVNQINWMLRKTFGELTYVDDNNQFIWYNRPYDKSTKMLANRTPNQVGSTMGEVHPDVRDVIPEAKKVVYALRNKVAGHDEVKMPVPNGNRHKLILHDYKRIEDENGDYVGIYEWVQDIYPFVKYFCETTGQKLVDDPDAMTGATYKNEKDTSTGASRVGDTSEAESKPDTNSGASE